MATSPVLVLTATVDPKGMRLTARSNPEVRFADYEDALGKWLATPAFPKIVFCENSGHDLSRLEVLAKSSNKEVEFLSFTAPDFPEVKGKGYGEMLIIQHAIEHSKLIQPSDKVFKVTGRLFIQNAVKIEKALNAQPETDVFCDLRSLLDYTESRAFCATVEFLTRYLIPFADDMDEEAEPMMNFERLLARAIHRAMADGKVWSLMPTTPRFTGFSGTFGNKYRTGPRWFASELARTTRKLLQKKLH